jgi:RNA polymerase sigma-70 factor (ECF subfamily)
MDKKEKKTYSLTDEDKELIISFNSGSKRAFDSLVLKYKDSVFNLCYRFLGDYEESDDSAQETFIKVYRSLKKFRFESAFSTWLYRIAVNTCKNKLSSLKYRRNRKMVRLDNGREGDPHINKISDTSGSPEKNFEKKEREKLIQKAIDSLPDDFKSVVVLCDIEGLSYEMTARITGYNIGTVKSKLSRARERLREKLRESITDHL